MGTSITCPPPNSFVPLAGPRRIVIAWWRPNGRSCSRTRWPRCSSSSGRLDERRYADGRDFQDKVFGTEVAPVHHPSPTRGFGPASSEIDSEIDQLPRRDVEGHGVAEHGRFHL